MPQNACWLRQYLVSILHVIDMWDIRHTRSSLVSCTAVVTVRHTYCLTNCSTSNQSSLSTTGSKLQIWLQLFSSNVKWLRDHRSFTLMQDVDIHTRRRHTYRVSILSEADMKLCWVDGRSESNSFTVRRLTNVLHRLTRHVDTTTSSCHHNLRQSVKTGGHLKLNYLATEITAQS